MNRQIYVMIGETAEDWCNNQPLGPFGSEMKAREAIRDDVRNDIDGSDMLSEGNDPNYCEKYHLVEYVKAFRPALNTTVKITLKQP